MVADTFQICETSSENLNSFDTRSCLNSEVHFVFLGVGDGVATEVYVRAEKRHVRYIDIR
jgi:hypothetical protein